MYDVVALGEFLVDFSPSGNGHMGNPCYEMNPGGAPSNCLAACSALGGNTALIASVGDDLFGRFLRQKAVEARIDISSVLTVPESTTLVFVALDAQGEREFAFVRSPGADTRIQCGNIPINLLENTRFFHFGTLSMTSEPASSSTHYAVEYAQSIGVSVSFDPNYRAGLWDSETRAKECMYWGAHADVVKLSNEELYFMTGKDIERGAYELLDLGVSELYVTAGAKGAYYFTVDEAGYVPGFSVPVVDTTGCGDAFTGAILFQSSHMPEHSCSERVRFANAVGALCATKPGGMCAMPGLPAVETLLEGRTTK